MKRTGFSRCLVALGLAWAGGAAAQPYGIETRAENTSLLIDALPGAEGEVTPVPQLLSDIPALLAAGLGEDQSSAGILPYRPSTELWSDGALKTRFLALPGLGQMGYRADKGGTSRTGHPSSRTSGCRWTSGIRKAPRS
jgi:hypothetical protein